MVLQRTIALVFRSPSSAVPYRRTVHVSYREPPPANGHCVFEWARGRLFDEAAAEMYHEVRQGYGRSGGRWSDAARTGLRSVRAVRLSRAHGGARIDWTVIDESMARAP